MSSLLHKFKVLMEKNEYFSKAIPYLLETKFVRYSVIRIKTSFCSAE